MCWWFEKLIPLKCQRRETHYGEEEQKILTEVLNAKRINAKGKQFNAKRRKGIRLTT